MSPASDPEAESTAPAASAVPFREALRAWCKVALLSFGGPAGQVAVMQRILVDEKRWISQPRFLHALNYCMLLPGPEAQQLATYVGWLLHRTWGGLVAGTLFVLPGFLSILGLSIAYVQFGGAPLVEAAFAGLKPAVVAVVLVALIRIGRRTLVGRDRRLLAAAAFVAIFFLEVPFPAIVIGAGGLGYVLGRRSGFALGEPSGTKAKDETEAEADRETEAAIGRAADEPPPTETAVDGVGALPRHAGPAAASRATPPPGAASRGAVAAERPSWRRAAAVLAIGLTAWWLPVLGLVVLLGHDSVLVHEALFFSKTAVVTFGGAYAVLSYVAQRAVEDFGWLAPGEMLDGLGMAESTPGPLIQVVQFVGFLGAYRNPGPFSPLVAGVLGSIVTTWVTFVPCFLWIFLGAPYVEWLRGRRRLAGALAAISAAVAGVILNLAAWFALHVFFGEVREVRGVAGRLLVPEWATVDPLALAIAGGAVFALLRLRLGLLTTLALAVVVGVLARGPGWG